MANRSEQDLNNILKLVKPEYKEELKKLLLEIAAEWDSLSDDDKEEVYDGDGTIFWVLDRDIWDEKFPFEKIVINSADADLIGNDITDYVCPDESGFKLSDLADHAFDQDWNMQKPSLQQYFTIKVMVDVPEDEAVKLENEISDYLDKAGVKYNIELD